MSQYLPPLASNIYRALNTTKFLSLPSLIFFKQTRAETTLFENMFEAKNLLEMQMFK